MGADLSPLHETADAIVAARLSTDRLNAEAIAAAVAGAEAAYAVQRLVSARAPATALGPAVGYKIGMSTAGAQRLYDLSEPISGHIFQSRLLTSGAKLRAARRRRIGVECEVAVRLKDDLIPGGMPFDERSVAGAVGHYHAGIEILEDRFVDSHGASVWALAADDMLGFGGVLGEQLVAFDPLAGHEGSIAIDGRIAGQGSTLDLSGGGPLSGLAWLANRLGAEGRSCKAGDIVYCGGITAPVWIEPAGAAATTIVGAIDGRDLAGFTIHWTD